MFRLRKPGEGWGGGRLKRQKAGLITSPNYISSPRPFFRAPPLLESSLRTAAPSPTPSSIIGPDTSPLSPALPHSPFPLSSSSAGEGGNPREETGRWRKGLRDKRGGPIGSETVRALPIGQVPPESTPPLSPPPPLPRRPAALPRAPGQPHGGEGPTGLEWRLRRCQWLLLPPSSSSGGGDAGAEEERFL